MKKLQTFFILLTAVFAIHSVALGHYEVGAYLLIIAAYGVLAYLQSSAIVDLKEIINLQQTQIDTLNEILEEEFD